MIWLLSLFCQLLAQYTGSSNSHGCLYLQRWNLWLQYSVLDCLDIYIGHLAIFVWRPVDSLWFYWVVASQGSTRAYFIPRDSHIAARYERLPIGRRQEGEGGRWGHQLWKGGCLPCLSASQHLIGQYRPEEGWGVAVLCCASALSSMHPDKMHPVVQLRMQPCDEIAILKRLHRHTGAIIIWGLYTLFIYKCDAWGQWKTSSSAISVYVPEGLTLFD